MFSYMFFTCHCLSCDMSCGFQWWAFSTFFFCFRLIHATYSESDKDNSRARMSVEAEPQHCQIMQPNFHSPASSKKLQWADLECVELGPEVSCLDPTAPPPSREARRKKSPPSKQAVKIIKWGSASRVMVIILCWYFIFFFIQIAMWMLTQFHKTISSAFT